MAPEATVMNTEYPGTGGELPSDAGETFDLVVRKGPISYDGLMDQIHAYSGDKVFGHLSALEEYDYVTRREGDIHEDGTTRDLYEVHPSRINDAE
jgi:hypothetical protein